MTQRVYKIQIDDIGSDEYVVLYKALEEFAERRDGEKQAEIAKRLLLRIAESAEFV